jgi:Flp pilus assembly protein TadG
MQRELKRRRCRGNALIEFVLVGIPLVFMTVSVEEMSRGMWQYHTLQYACKMANAYAAVHGATCAQSPNSCTVDVSNVVGVFESNAIGVPMSSVAVTLTSENNSASCSKVSTCSSGASWSTEWPPSANTDNQVGKWIKFRADYTFSTALALFWPGAGKPVIFGSTLGAGQFDLPGFSYQLIQF